MLSVVGLCVQRGLEASTLRNTFLDNLNSGLKMLGKNDRRVYFSHQSPYDRFPAGISNNIADLVSQSFSPKKSNGERNNIRQDAIVIGDETPPLSDTLMGGVLKLLGFDTSKIGAVAVNGIVFIAQMVRYGASRLMDYMMTKTWDWYQIVDYLGERVMNGTTNGTTSVVSRTRF